MKVNNARLCWSKEHLSSKDHFMSPESLPLTAERKCRLCMFNSTYTIMHIHTQMTHSFHWQYWSPVDPCWQKTKLFMWQAIRWLWSLQTPVTAHAAQILTTPVQTLYGEGKCRMRLRKLTSTKTYGFLKFPKLPLFPSDKPQSFATHIDLC